MSNHLAELLTACGGATVKTAIDAALTAAELAPLLSLGLLTEGRTDQAKRPRLVVSLGGDVTTDLRAGSRIDLVSVEWDLRIDGDQATAALALGVLMRAVDGLGATIGPAVTSAGLIWWRTAGGALEPDDETRNRAAWRVVARCDARLQWD